MTRYQELLKLIEDAEERQQDASTEYEWEVATAELEELYAERDQIESIDDALWELEMNDIRNAGF